MTTRIRIGVQIQPQHAEYAQIRRAAAEAEELGVDIVFNWDHFYPLSGAPGGQALRVLDDAGCLGGGYLARADRGAGDV